MKFAWNVHVRDSKGANVTDAKVSLVQASALDGKEFPFDAIAPTHTHKADGAYEPAAEIAPAAGEWALLVRRTAASPVVQPFTFTAKGDDFVVTTPGGLLATVDPKAGGTETAKTFNFTVTLFPSSEIILLSGTDPFSAKVIFRDFAEGRARGLFKTMAAGRTAAENETPVDKGTRITMFVCDERARFTFGYGHDGKLVQVAKKSFGDASGITPGQKHAPGAGDISAPIFYQYIHTIGSSEPKRVLEVSIFSHSWPGGPILFNTNDAHDGVRGPFQAGRDASDFDFRIKDFNKDNIIKWPTLKVAMADNGRWQIWGCSAVTSQKDEMTEALKAGSDDQLFSVNTDEKFHDGTVGVHLDAMLTRAVTRVLLDAPFRDDNTYAAAAAAFLGKPVFAAPPGAGADYSAAQGVKMMGIAGTTSPYFFYQQEFKPDFKPTTGVFNHGYIDYLRMQKRAPLPEVKSNSGIYFLTQNFSSKVTTLRFWTEKRPPDHPGTNVKLSVTVKKGMVDPAQSGRLYVLTDKDNDANSAAFFVQDDGELFKVDRSPNGAFDLPTAMP